MSAALNHRRFPLTMIHAYLLCNSVNNRLATCCQRKKKNTCINNTKTIHVVDLAVRVDHLPIAHVLLGWQQSTTVLSMRLLKPLQTYSYANRLRYRTLQRPCSGLPHLPVPGGEFSQFVNCSAIKLSREDVRVNERRVFWVRKRGRQGARDVGFTRALCIVTVLLLSRAINVGPLNK